MEPKIIDIIIKCLNMEKTIWKWNNNMENNMENDYVHSIFPTNTRKALTVTDVGKI